MRYYDRETADEIRFLLKASKLKSALLKSEDTDEIAASLAADVNSLPHSIGAVAEKETRIREVLSPAFWKNVSLEAVEAL